MKAFLSWTARHVLLFVLLALAIAANEIRLPAMLSDWVRGAGMSSTAEVSKRLAAKQANAERQFDSNVSSFRDSSMAKRAAALEERKVRLREVKRALADEPGFFDGYNPSVLLERQALKLEKAAIESEISLLSGHATSTSLRQQLSQIRFPTKGSIADAGRECSNANAAVRTFNDQVIRREDEAVKLTNAAKRKCGAERRLRNLRIKGRQQEEVLRKQVSQADARIKALEGQGRKSIKAVKSDPVQETFGDILRKATIALLALILMPFTIRTLFYFVLAPLAERRAHIRIAVPDNGDAQLAPSVPSRVSVPVVLGDGEELLVRQGYLQTSSLVGSKSTRWLLDYRYVLSSLAAGLRFLTRIRGDGETTTISAVHDPLAELAEITMPKGSACVLHPRSLVAVIQPIEQPVRIRSHWRLFSFSAWLTLQLRYLSFHGPCRLVLKGGRGIRVERAEKGRIFGQDQLVGFSVDLAYSVTRTETFAPYFWGKESLFKDKVEKGSGIIVIEESPLASRRSKGVRGGLEGAIDAFLKAFGI